MPLSPPCKSQHLKPLQRSLVGYLDVFKQGQLGVRFFRAEVLERAKLFSCDFEIVLGRR